MAHDHDLGTYHTLGVYYEFDAPWDFINECEEALEVFNNAVSWEELKEHYEKKLFPDEDDEEFDDEEL